MEKVDFVIINSNENKTALIISRHLDKRQYSISKAILELYPVEQVGFLQEPNKIGADAKISMMGGEFCGNALAALGVYIGERNNIGKNNKVYFKFETSGSYNSINCSVINKGEHYRVKVQLPLPITIRKNKIKFQNNFINMIFIDYIGIKTITLETEKFNDSIKLFAHKMLEVNLDKLCPLNIISLFSIKNKSILPLVYVSKTKTKIWESSCALASASGAISLASKENKSVKRSIKQPSKTYIDIEVEYKQKEISKLTMEQNVNIIMKDSIYLKI